MSFDSFRRRQLHDSRRQGYRLRSTSWKRRFLGLLHMLGEGITWCIEHRPKDRAELRLFVLKAAGWGVGILLLYFAILWMTLPDISDPRSLIASQSTVIVDRNGVELYRLYSEQDRTFIPGDTIPTHMKQATISIEDQRFYDRGCLDLRAIARVVFKLGRAGGGSTITRQLARNALDLKTGNRYNRKVKEFILGCQLENQFTKEELLELYLNWIPFGQNAYGIEQASHVYFNTSADNLTLAQSAILASLPQRPSYFSPYGSHRYTSVSQEAEEAIVAEEIGSADQVDDDDIRIGLLGGMVGTGATTIYMGGRSDQVLRNMEDQEFITESERLSALEEIESVDFQPSRENIRAPHFVLQVRSQIEEMFKGSLDQGMLEQGGLRIETTLDWDLQQIAEEIVESHREDVLLRYAANNIAILSVDPETREILSYVGNMDYDDTENGGKIDMVQAARQPGSSFKPFVYASAFRQGYSPATVLYDVPTKIGDDEPKNFDGTFMGPQTIRYALASSRNIPAAKAFFLGGGENTILALVNDMGAPSPHARREQLNLEREDGFDYGWPLALGAAETPLYEMVQAYSTFAGAGVYKPLLSIRKITDKHGNLLFESEQESRDVLGPRIAYQITSILSDPEARPEEYWRTQLSIPGYETAAKTGTSNKCLERDEDDGKCLLSKPDNAWLIGYTPNLVTGVWVGNANSASMYDKAGGLNTASPLWRDYMVRAHRRLDNTKKTFDVPDGIVRAQISLLSGQLPTECTPVEMRRGEVFLRENAPTLADPACAQLTIDKVTRLLASEGCPKDAQEDGSFLIARSLLPQRWPEWEEGVVEWTKQQMEIWYATENHSGAIIPLPVAPIAECDIALTPGRTDKPELDIIFPSDGGIATYPTFKPRLKYAVGSSVEQIEFYIDEKRVAKRTEEPFLSAIRIPRTVKESGQHSLKVILTDSYFNTITKVVHFRFDEDKTKPAVHIIFPRDGTTIPSGSQITITAEARDTNGAIKYVQFYLDDVLLSTKPSEPYEMNYGLNLDDGSHVIRVVAEDMAKNTASDSSTFTIGHGQAQAFTLEPYILSPSKDIDTLVVGDILDIRINTPAIGVEDVQNLSLVVRHDASSEDHILMEMKSGSLGTYVRPWKAKKPGTYSIFLFSLVGGEEKVWDSRRGLEVR